MNDKEVMLGYGDGTLMVYDFKKHGLVRKMKDPYQEKIGEIRFDFNEIFVTFGVPEFTIWQYNDKDVIPRAHFNFLTEDNDILTASAYTFFIKDFYKTSGCFLGNNQLAVTDTLGSFAVFDYGLTS